MVGPNGRGSVGLELTESALEPFDAKVHGINVVLKGGVIVGAEVTIRTVIVFNLSVNLLNMRPKYIGFMGFKGAFFTQVNLWFLDLRFSNLIQKSLNQGRVRILTR